MDQGKELRVVLQKSVLIQETLNRAGDLALPNWYLGGGIVAQTVWNHRHGFSASEGIKDCDLVYFDPDTSLEKEDLFIRKGHEIFKDIRVPVEIRNQARVHLWYKKAFGYHICPYSSAEEAIETWLTTATSIGIRKNNTSDKALIVYAPFGLDDLLNLVVRPNKRLITEDIYLRKVTRWRAVWPGLKIVPWTERTSLVK